MLQRLGDGLPVDGNELTESAVVSALIITTMRQLFVTFRDEFTIQNIYSFFAGYLFHDSVVRMWHDFSFLLSVVKLVLTLIIFVIIVAIPACLWIYPLLGVYISYDIVKRNFQTTPEAIVMGPRPVKTISYYSQALMFQAMKSTSVLEEILHALGEDGRYQLTWELYRLHTSHTIRSFRTILNSYHNLCQESVNIKGRTNSLKS